MNKYFPPASGHHQDTWAREVYQLFRLQEIAAQQRLRRRSMTAANLPENQRNLPCMTLAEDHWQCTHCGQTYTASHQWTYQEGDQLVRAGANTYAWCTTCTVMWHSGQDLPGFQSRSWVNCWLSFPSLLQRSSPWTFYTSLDVFF